MKKLAIISSILFVGFYPLLLRAALKDVFPKTANLYLNPIINKDYYDDLAKYDLLILDVDVTTTDENILKSIRQLNPKIEILAYIPAQSVNTQDLGSWASFRKKTYAATNNGNWWLKNEQGCTITFPGWDTINFVDGGSAWNKTLSDLSVAEVNKYGWDGVFYDMVFSSLSWINGGNIDFDKNGQRDSASKIDTYWNSHMSELLKETDKKLGGKHLVANIDKAENFEGSVNGVLMENFPAPWFGSNAWNMLMDQYLNKLPDRNQDPNIYVINANTGNTGGSDSYRKMRFGLASTLLGDGYYGFDFGDTNHAQTWWYDEFSAKLGKAESAPSNLLDKNNKGIKSGLWRRDFVNGIALVNSTNQDQTYVFTKEEFEKLHGNQDKKINDGSKINWIRISAQDGLVLLKVNKNIVDSGFDNGSFMRVFNQAGQQTQNGFFSYKDAYPGNVQVLSSDVDGDGEIEVLVNGGGRISVYKNGKKTSTFEPYNGKFKGEISFAVADLNGDNTKEIITGAGIGGGPHVRVFTKEGKPLIGGFFAYDKNFRGGVRVAVMDLNGDATQEIITGAGPGGGSHVRVFTKDGKALVGGFFAYGQSFRGGVSVATGDVDGDKIKEIITGAGPGGGPHVKIFSKDGKLKKEFFAYDKTMNSGIKVMANDLNKDGIMEVLVSAIGF